MSHEIAFTIDSSSIKFGPGATREVGYDLKALGARRVMAVVDPNLKDGETVAIALDSLRREGIDGVVYDQVRIEPSDLSLQAAAQFAAAGAFDGYLAVGGGSTIDTAKAANLYATYPADFFDYVNAPIGKGLPVPGPLRPMVAVPTTAGSGSEVSGMAIFGVSGMQVKTAIGHRALRPSLGIIDPDNTRTVPRMVAICVALDVLCPALEGLTALPYTSRLAAESPGSRPTYQGANPISDIWSARAAEMCVEFLPRVLADPSDDEARAQMILASTYGSIGFGNSGTTLAHGMSYPVCGMVRDYFPDGYPKDHPMIPHGMGVALVAPAAFRFMGPAKPDRFPLAARLMGVDTAGVAPEAAGELVASRLVDLMRRLGMPNGLKAVGYTEDDVDKLVEGTLPQHRVIKLSPRPASVEDFRRMFLESMTLW